MTILGSLVAFGLVFFITTLGLSLLFNGLLLISVRHLRRLGCWAERQAATAALVLPPLLGLSVVAALAAESALALAGGSDHCLVHGHHLHLCVKHGAAWLEQPWALALIAALTTFVAIRAALSVWSHAMAQRAASQLRSLGTRLGERDCYLVPSTERFAFTAGVISPTVIFSSAAWTALSPEEREAIVAHELAHISNGDLPRRVWLGFAASLGAPLLSDHALRLWELSAERICDRHAAQVVGRPSTVATAILALVRSAPPRIAPAGAVFAAAHHVSERVRSVLGDEPGGELTARRLVLSFSAIAVVLAACCAVFAEPLHHLLETLLG